MLLGVVSDTHNNFKNIAKIIEIFNANSVDLVIHTGDITNSKSLRLFSDLEAKLIGVYGNNDLCEHDLEDTCREFNFIFKLPPLNILKAGIKISIFHEPEHIDSHLEKFPQTSLIFHGHTHRYRNEKINNCLIINPGESAGLIKGSNALGLIDLPSLNYRRILF